MSSSSRAQNRALKAWFDEIRTGGIVLPSFQRYEAWDRARVGSMLDTVIRDLPLGVALVLDVGDEEQFVSRPLASAPPPERRPREHLLDGQQRLTALWRSLHDNYSDVSYFVHVPALDDDPTNDDNEVGVRVVNRWTSGQARKPLWADIPRGCYERGLIPVRLLNPAAERDALEWADHATTHLAPGENITDLAEYKAQQALHLAARDELKDEWIQPLRKIVETYNLPYLLLGAATPKHVALDVFIKMNTNSKPLSTFDVIVAEVESETGDLLHNRIADLSDALPELERYGDVGEFVLQTSALLQGRTPSARGALEMSKSKMIANWEVVTSGFARTIALLEGAHIYDAKRLPTAIPLPVLAALFARVPKYGDVVGNATRLLRAYLWSACFTGRYENSAPTRASADHRELGPVLDSLAAGQPVDLLAITVLDREQYPLPTLEQLMGADWPTRRRGLARSILAASLVLGSEDFADAHRISADNVDHREYHHLFPDALLKEVGVDSYLALNCALITWRTNRTIGRLDPVAYLEARAEASIGDRAEIERRLLTHLVPMEELVNAGPYGALDSEPARQRVRDDFGRFLDRRAELIHRAMTVLCDGGALTQAALA